jgi:hypothetical protein
MRKPGLIPHLNWDSRQRYWMVFNFDNSPFWDVRLRIREEKDMVCLFIRAQGISAGLHQIFACSSFPSRPLAKAAA